MAQKDKRQQSVVVCYQGHDITDFVAPHGSSLNPNRTPLFRRRRT